MATGGVEMESGAGTNQPGGGAGGAIEPNAIHDVKPTLGCGEAATQATSEFVKYTLPTMGVKDADCADHLAGVPKCGPWSLEREYFVWLPPGYDPNQAYPLVVQGTGCGGTGKDVYDLSSDNKVTGVGVDHTVIRVGLTPPPISIGHGTNPGEGCYDDKEGDDSVDIVFFQGVLDKLRGQLCFDQNRVYVSGDYSGASLANELACKFAGDDHGYAVRAVTSNGGGLPTEPEYTPTCSDKPVAGVWASDTGDLSFPFDTTSKVAINRAMKTNSCASSDYDTAVAANQLEDFPIGAGKPADTCKRITGCAEDYPLVICRFAGTGQNARLDIANPAFATLFKTLAAK